MSEKPSMQTGPNDETVIHVKPCEHKELEGTAETPTDQPGDFTQEELRLHLESGFCPLHLGHAYDHGFSGCLICKIMVLESEIETKINCLPSVNNTAETPTGQPARCPDCGSRVKSAYGQIMEPKHGAGTWPKNCTHDWHKAGGAVPQTPTDALLDEMVRDFCKVGPKPKSEVRSRIQAYASAVTARLTEENTALKQELPATLALHKSHLAAYAKLQAELERRDKIIAELQAGDRKGR